MLHRTRPTGGRAKQRVKQHRCREGSQPGRKQRKPQTHTHTTWPKHLRVESRTLILLPSSFSPPIATDETRQALHGEKRGRPHMLKHTQLGGWMGPPAYSLSRLSVRRPPVGESLQGFDQPPPSLSLTHTGLPPLTHNCVITNVAHLGC